jgi:Ca2+-binding RTX toxin-like protein
VALAAFGITTAGAGLTSGQKCNGLAVTVGGATPGPDTLTGTPGDDVIGGLGGNDKIFGRGGNDTICGDAGADRMSGGPGNDTIIGHNRDPSTGMPPTFEVGDVAAPGPGDDLTAVTGLDYSQAAGPVHADLNSSVVSGEGTDQVPGATRAGGSAYADTMIGPPVAGTILRGRGGNDHISDEDSGQLFGGDGNDMLTGASGNDTLGGGNGDDVLVGGGGVDVFYGRTGNDVLKTHDGIADAVIDCGPGTADAANIDGGLDPSPVGCESVVPH